MGFLLVFDATVEESLKTAMEMFTNICLQSASKTTLPCDPQSPSTSKPLLSKAVSQPGLKICEQQVGVKLGARHRLKERSCEGHRKLTAYPMMWLLLSLLLQAASGHQPSQVPKLRRANGTVTFNSWVMLDPASSQAFERTQNLRVHEFLPSYVSMYKAGKAQELMPDPFIDAPSLEGLKSKEGQVHDARALAELRLPGAPSAEGNAVQLPCRFEEDHDYVGVDALTVPHSNKEDCCRACRHLNRRKAGNCVVAVLSGPLDDPPYQCWIKTKILSAKVVKGVVACVPV